MESSSSQVSVEPPLDLDYTFAFNNANFSDRILRVEIIPSSKTDPTNHVADCALTHNRDQDSNVHEAVQGNENQSSTEDPERLKTIHINTAILATKSPFFYKLFSNGMSESNKSCVTLQVQDSEEAAFMDLLKFMYTNTLSSTTPSVLLDVLIAADRYEVPLCMKYCLCLLAKSPMTCESAVLYFDLPSTILMDTKVRPLADAAKEFLVAHFKDISEFQEEILNLSLVGVEAILSSDNLEVDSEDKIYDFVMKWAQRHYTMLNERQEILNTCLLRLIRFQYMSCDKLKELLSCTYINPKCSSKLLFKALSFHMSPLVSRKERAYKLRPVKVLRFDSPREECVVYLDLKREECARLLPSKCISTREFHLGGQTFCLQAWCLKESHKSSRTLGLYLSKCDSAGGFVAEYEFSSRTKPSEEFVVVKTKRKYNFAKGNRDGISNLSVVAWDTFIAEASPYFINGVLHLRAVITIKG